MRFVYKGFGKRKKIIYGFCLVVVVFYIIIKSKMSKIKFLSLIVGRRKVFNTMVISLSYAVSY